MRQGTRFLSLPPCRITVSLLLLSGLPLQTSHPSLTSSGAAFLLARFHSLGVESHHSTDVKTWGSWFQWKYDQARISLSRTSIRSVFLQILKTSILCSMMLVIFSHAGRCLHLSLRWSLWYWCPSSLTVIPCDLEVQESLTLVLLQSSVFNVLHLKQAGVLFWKKPARIWYRCAPFTRLLESTGASQVSAVGKWLSVLRDFLVIAVQFTKSNCYWSSSSYCLIRMLGWYLHAACWFTCLSLQARLPALPGLPVRGSDSGSPSIAMHSTGVPKAWKSC